MIKNIALILACLSFGVAANAKSSGGGSSDSGFYCYKHVNGKPIRVPCF